MIYCLVSQGGFLLLLALRPRIKPSGPGPFMAIDVLVVLAFRDVLLVLGRIHS